MEVRPVTVILAAALLAAGVAAIVRTSTSKLAAAEPSAPASASTHAEVALPPNHPPIGAGGAGGAMPTVAAANEAPALAWTAPAPFASVTSTSAMRLATYHVAPVAGDADPAELTVVRAGGTTDANIDRWVRQFDDAGKETKTEKTVAGFKVTIVEVGGTFLGSGMSPTGAPEPKKGWMLLGAIVETNGSPYFFKMTGPAGTVKSARAGFVAMIDGLTKT